MSIDAAGTRPIPEQDKDVLTAIARVEASLRIVLAKIAELKREMNQPTQPTDVPLRPDPSWVGTP